MDTQAFQEFLANQTPQIDFVDFGINLVLVAILSYLLGQAYIHFGTSLSNRRKFAGNFVLLAMATMVIISIVKSSLALSLGLVGALSIVRFRSAIKEPEELTFLFINIALGLGLGANQRGITLAAFLAIGAVVIIRGLKQFRRENHSLYLTLSLPASDKTLLDRVSDILGNHCHVVKLKRLDESSAGMEAAFLADFKDVEGFRQCRTELLELGEGIRFTFLDDKVMV